MDQCWYQGCVKHFDEIAGKHLVLYDDAEEELLSLSREKIEWLVEEPVLKKFRRLRRISVVEDDEENEGNSESRGDHCHDDSADEDLVQNAEKEVVEDASEDMDWEDVDAGGKTSERSKKRKLSVRVGKPVSVSTKKSKSVRDTKQNPCKVPSVFNDRKPIESPIHTVESKCINLSFFVSLNYFSCVI